MVEEEAADQLAALGHPARLRVLRTLMAAGDGGTSARSLAEAAGLAPNATTFHLNRLRLAGLAHRRRQGREARYVADFAAVRTLLDFLSSTCCAGPDSSGPCGPVCGETVGASGSWTPTRSEEDEP